MDNLILAEYLRISSEDEDLRHTEKLESNSIGNQRNLLNSFIAQRSEFDGATVLEFCDDGWSGKNFERPAVKELLKQVKQGSIHCILVKDFSRFGRDYLTVDSYIFRVFPFLNVRFISVNDNFDSCRPGALDGLDTPFRTLLYDYYSSDLSRKVRSARSLRARQGRFLSPWAPFGYRKDPNDKSRLIPDPPAAEIVKRIFAMAIAGRSTTQIAETLNREGVPTPMIHKRMSGCSRTSWPCVHENNYWTHCTVLVIIQDERYIGANIFGKRVRAEIGSSRTVKSDRADWIYVPDTHESLVSKADFQLAQNALQNAGKPGVCTQSERPLQRKIYCAMCGHVMEHRRASRPYYICRSYRLTDAFHCTGERFPEDDLQELLLEALRKQASAAVTLERVWQAQNKKDKTDIALTRKTLAGLKEHRDKYEVQIKKLYEDFALGDISKEDYLERKAILIKERDGAVYEITKMESSLANAENGSSLQNSFVDHFKPYTNVQSLSCEIVKDVLKKVLIYPGQRVEVVWNYMDDYMSLVLELKGAGEGENMPNLNLPDLQDCYDG